MSIRPAVLMMGVFVTAVAGIVNPAMAAACERVLTAGEAQAVATRLGTLLRDRVEDWTAGTLRTDVYRVGPAKNCPEPFAIRSYDKSGCSVTVTVVYQAGDLAKARAPFTRGPYSGPVPRDGANVYRLDVPASRKSGPSRILHEAVAYKGRLAVYFMNPKANIGACGPFDRILAIVNLATLPKIDK